MNCGCAIDNASAARIGSSVGLRPRRWPAVLGKSRLGWRAVQFDVTEEPIDESERDGTGRSPCIIMRMHPTSTFPSSRTRCDGKIETSVHLATGRFSQLHGSDRTMSQLRENTPTSLSQPYRPRRMWSATNGVTVCRLRGIGRGNVVQPIGIGLSGFRPGEKSVCVPADQAGVGNDSCYHSRGRFKLGECGPNGER